MYLKEKITFCFCFTFISFTLSLAQVSGWEMQESGVNTFLSDVYFINSDTGWVAGNGIILNTTDGGGNWTVQDSSDVYFNAITFTDMNHGWAVGYMDGAYYGAIYHTIDGGQTWYLSDSTRYDLDDIFFVNPDIGYAVGGGRGKSTILKTTDAGVSWEMLAGSSSHLYTVQFINDTTGWTAGERGRVLRTEDGGTSWDVSYLDLGDWSLESIYFINQDTGWVVGSDEIFKTTDGGESWEPMEGLDNQYYHSCYFINSNTGWIGGGNFWMSAILYTTDGGNSLQVQDSIENDGGQISSIFFIDDSTGWSVGNDGAILKTFSGGIVSIGDIGPYQDLLPEHFGLYQNVPNPFNYETTISYQLPVSGQIKLTIYNHVGAEIITLVDETQSAGTYDLTFNGTGLANGMYFYKLSDGRNNSVKKMLLLR